MVHYTAIIRSLATVMPISHWLSHPFVYLNLYLHLFFIVGSSLIDNRLFFPKTAWTAETEKNAEPSRCAIRGGNAWEGRVPEKSESLWKSMFPIEPFQTDYTAAEVKYTPKSTYNLYEASQRQMKFYYNISLPHYGNTQFLTTALGRYKKFLYLRYVKVRHYNFHYVDCIVSLNSFRLDYTLD